MVCINALRDVFKILKVGYIENHMDADIVGGAMRDELAKWVEA